MKVFLKNWKLAGYHPWVPLQGASMETGYISPGVTGVFDAVVPGSIYADLLRAGAITDPYYEMNSLSCEWVPNRYWVYRTEFEVPASKKGSRVRLIFKGIDDRALIYVNNKFFCEHEGMYEPVVLDITDICKFGKEPNAVKVILRNAQDEMGQIGLTSMTYTQKARFTYKWDFCTRLVGIGIWNDVLVEITGKGVIESRHGYYDGASYTDTVETDGADGMTLTGVLSFRGKKVGECSRKVKKGKATLSVKVKDPELWYPNGWGKQPLYDWKLTLSDGEAVSDEKAAKVGLRTLTYERCDGAIETALPYIPVINGKRILIKGVNMTPLDMMYGCVDAERYDKMLKLAKAANVDVIRVWGGGVIEKEAFYDLCDKYGIMVWQEFIQSSSGIDNIPSKDPRFLALIEKTAIAALKEKRNHVSLTFWSGGNELMDKNGIPSKYEDENIALLKGLCTEYDPEILMLPTSASGPSEWNIQGKPEMNHDIHGPWKYDGPVGHYSIYNTATCMLHSEFGCDGMTNLPMIEKYLAPENRDKVYTVANNLTWRHHGEWWDTTWRDFNIFGDLTNDLPTFVTVSQYIQGEAIRYALEAHRRRAWQCCGAIIWQFNEPWPNVSCTCVVDYECNPKFAYYYYRDAMKPYHISMRYDKLIWSAGEEFTGTLALLDDTASGKPSKISAVAVDQDGNVLGTSDTGLKFTIPEGTRYFTVECTAKEGRRSDKNTYLFFVKGEGRPDGDAEAVKRLVAAYLANEA